MDNLSHTLISVLVGEAISRTLPARRSLLPETTRRNYTVGLMAIGANLPDLDFLYSALTDNKLDYLLQHRGHTHTLLGALVLALLCAIACIVWLKRRGLPHSRWDIAYLAGIATLAPLLHITMDFTNSYGVHPFWPLDNRWVYGDSVFIVEPLFWACAAPLVYVLRSTVARAIVAIVLLTGLGLSFGLGLVPLALSIALTTVMLTLLAIAREATPRTAVLAGIAAWLLTTATFVTAGRIAGSDVRTHAAAFDGELLDHVLTPMPVNPFCWDVLTVHAQGDAYALRQATVSLAPSWLSAPRCPTLDAGSRTAPLAPTNEPASAAIVWRGEWVLSALELRRLAAAHCEVAALLRFARVPFYLEKDGTMLIGDLRYDREPEAAFAEIELNKDVCPAWIPRWGMPRADLL